MRRIVIAFLFALSLPGCAALMGTEDKEVYIGLGKGGAAVLNLPQVNGQVTGPFVYHSVPKDTKPVEGNEPPDENAAQ